MKNKPEIEEELDLEAVFGKNTEGVLDEEVFDNPNIKPVDAITSPKKKTSSFKAPIVDDEGEEVKPKKRRFIIKKVVIDQHNTKASRVELTPSVCDICAFDVAEKAGGWHQVGNDSRHIVRTALQKHKELVHTSANQLIIDEDEMPTKWLGGGRL